MLSQRRFGVEIECGFPGGYRAAEALLRQEKIKPLSVGADGTGVEVRSPILKGIKGLEWLKECMAALKENGGYVTERDGMHVHHEGIPGYREVGTRAIPKGINTIVCLRLIHSWKNNNDLIDRFVAKRRCNASYCSKVWKQDSWVKAYEDDGRTPGKYSDLNLSSLRAKGTVEIRLHEGTLDGEEAEAWIRLCQTFLERAVKEETPIPNQENVEKLLDFLVISDEVRECLLKKAKRKGKDSPNSGYIKDGPRCLPW